MPEIPDLENIKGFLNDTLPGVKITSVQSKQPLVIRFPTLADFKSTLEGSTFSATKRRGKFLLLSLSSKHILAINPMLTGRLQYTDPSTKQHAKTCFTLGLVNRKELRYYDSKLMGKVYLVADGQMNIIPKFSEMGPEALDPEMTLEVFEKRLRRHNGQVKNILVNDVFLAGIGNAYADEILYESGIHPYRRRSSLSQDEREALYKSMQSVLNEATDIVSRRMGYQIDVKFRDFLRIHGKGNHPCPKCESRISQVQANQRLTNFCRHCQK